MRVGIGRLVVVAALLVFLFVGASFEYLSFTQTYASYSGASFEGVTLAGPNALDTVGDIVHLYSVVSSPSPESVAALIVGIITSIQLNVTLSLYNGGILPVYIPAETNQVFVDGLLIGTSSTGSAWVWPGSSVTVHLAETIPTGQLLPIVSSAIESGGNVEYNIVGSASLAGVSAPFSKSGQLDIGAYLVKQLGIPIPGLT